MLSADKQRDDVEEKKQDISNHFRDDNDKTKKKENENKKGTNFRNHDNDHVRQNQAEFNAIASISNQHLRLLSPLCKM